MRSVLVFAIASACASPAAPPVAHSPPPIPEPSNPAGEPSGPLVARPATTGGMEAPPIGAIQLAAVTSDGGAAITADAGGGVRLWPTLDGTREPIVVAMDVPVDVAIERAGSGFIVGSIDESRGLVLTLLDGGGRTLAHRGLGGDPGFDGVASTSAGLLAWTTDSKIELFATDGALRATIATEPGERLRNVATSRAHVVADLEVAGSAAPRRRIRSVAIEPALAWGSFVGSDQAGSGTIAISPSGGRVAMVEGEDVVVVDVARGKNIMTAKATATSLAFADDGRIASANGGVMWFTESGLVPQLGPAPQQLSGGDTAIVASGSGNAIAIINGVLALATPQRIEYLGYAIASPSVVAAGGSDSLIVAAGDKSTLLDGSLRSHGSIAAGAATSFAWLGGDDWLAIGAGTRLASARGGEPKAIGSDTTEVLADYEPSTSIATASFGDAPAVYRWDAAAHALRPIASSPRTTPYLAVELVPTAPARANGTHLVRVMWRDHATVEWFSDDKLATRTATSEVASVLGVDSAARVYALTQGTKSHVAILANGAEVGQLPLSAGAAVYPDATGDRIAALTATSLDVYANGQHAWTHPVVAGRFVAWLSDGSLAVVSTSAIERIDATGHTVAQRCGWSFGLWPTPIAPPPQMDSPCSR